MFLIRVFTLLTYRSQKFRIISNFMNHISVVIVFVIHQDAYVITGVLGGGGMVILAGQPSVEVGRSCGVRPTPVAPK